MEPRNTHDATTKDHPSDTSELELKLGSTSHLAKKEKKSLNREETEHDLNDKIIYTSTDRLSSRGTKRDYLPSEESSNASSSLNEFPSTRPNNNVKLASILVRPHRGRSGESKSLEEKRKAVLESHRGDKNTLDRNRRMFGMLLGTLQQFKTEESGRERSTSKRSKIEEKLELAVDIEEANKVIEDDDASSNKRQLPQVNEDLLDKAGLRRDASSRFENWDKTHRNFCDFIRTESKPKIFWLPKQHNSITEKKLKETRDYFSLCVAERTAKFKKEMSDLGGDETEFMRPMQSECEDQKDDSNVDEKVEDVDRPRLLPFLESLPETENK